MNNARRFINNVRKITGKTLPVPVSYIGGGVNGKVYLTNSGKLMKIGLGSQPSEFRPLHILRNTKFVPKFNQRNWVIVPIAKRSYGKLKFLNSAKKLFPNKLGNIKRKYPRTVFKNMLRSKKATIFLMNKIGNNNTNKVMTLTNFLKKRGTVSVKAGARNLVKEMVKKIHEKGISHGNLHTNNILVSISQDGKIVKLWMIDFGRSTIIPIGNTERNAYAKKFKPNGEFNSRGILSRLLNYNTVPLFYNKTGIPRRLNSHMLKVHYGVNNYPRTVKRIS